MSWQGDETEECAYKGERLANGDKEACDATRVRETHTGRDRGLQDVRGSCLQLYLSSRIHRPHQDIWFHHPCLELAFSWNKCIMWMCYLQSSASVKTAIALQRVNQIKITWRTFNCFCRPAGISETLWVTSMEHVKLSTELILSTCEGGNVV